MASDHVWPVLGTVPALFGDAVEVAHDPANGDLRIGLSGPGGEDECAWLDTAGRDKLRELLDRAAMPEEAGLGRQRLAVAIAQVREAHDVPLARYAVTADQLAAELLDAMQGQVSGQ